MDFTEIIITVITVAGSTGIWQFISTRYKENKEKEKFDHIKQIHNNLKFDDLTGLPNKNYFFDESLFDQEQLWCSDMNSDNSLDITDIVFLVNFIFVH